MVNCNLRRLHGRADMGIEDYLTNCSLQRKRKMVGSFMIGRIMAPHRCSLPAPKNL